ncbi:hypothetical protein AK812_SmicGene19787 [Symbiodinium microadriaticum]|uniref:Uncharacterized protein n=1 Tax=Symbiodinium microadriaticum TaxID=2951 RepID=A0A1Q9DRQ3_SYMMI|nr:hypothetical protein AK812_SmicGene19787 [Symbiodinium microadriaticum]
MTPKPKDGKSAGKTKFEERAPTTKLEFGYPADLTNALKAISDRATQDLWQSPGGSGGNEPTEEQIAQRHANTIHRLSKRIAGDVNAKDALRTALGQWTASLGHHLAALVVRVKAISQKLDDDLSEACQEMQSAAVVSVASQGKIAHAQAQLGPTWSAMQEQEIFRIAGALRAFSTVQPAIVASSLDPTSMDVGSAMSSAALSPGTVGSTRDLQTAPLSPASMSSSMTLGAAPPLHQQTSGLAGGAVPETRVTRWKRPAKGRHERPGKSPRREVPPPWTSVATGRTPEAAPRIAATLIDDDEELVPVHAPPSGPPSWFTSWLQVLSFAVNQGSDLIGELVSNAEQEAMLPLHPDAQIEDATVAQADVLWLELVHMLASPQERQMDGLYARIREFLQMVLVTVPCPFLPVEPSQSDGQVDDECYREICVFAPDLRSCHAALLVDVRLRGRALEVSICRALGRQAVEWDCYRVQESLPALPPEQYVLRKASTSWHLSVVPVDLRPVGGRLALAYADRVMPCGAIAHMAIADQAGLECPAELLCRTSQGWFEANAAILLLPHCDAFQVWPLQLVQAAPPPTTLSLLRQPSGSDRFESSLEPTSGPERALSEREISSAVVLSDNGLFYCQVDGFADKDSIRSSVLFAYLGPSGLGIEYGGITHFARVLPPLPDLPAVQFVAGCCEGPLQPTVVDLRALQGSLQVCCAEPDATPAQRIELAVAAGLIAVLVDTGHDLDLSSLILSCQSLFDMATLYLRASTLTVVLQDVCDSLGDIIVVTADSPTPGMLPLAHLKEGITCGQFGWEMKCSVLSPLKSTGIAVLLN